MSFIEGETICLNSLTRMDIPVLHAWFNDPVVTEHMNKGAFPNSEEIQEEFIQGISKSKNDLQLTIILKENNSLVGTVGIHKIDWIHRHGDVSVVMGDRNHWGKGIAKNAIALVIRHAFTKMNLKRLTAGMSALNIRSRKCFEDNGFALEGIRRKHFFYRGEYVDVLMLGILREEWAKHQNTGC